MTDQFTDNFFKDIPARSIVERRVWSDASHASLVIQSKDKRSVAEVMACTCEDVAVYVRFGFAYTRCAAHGAQPCGSVQFSKRRGDSERRRRSGFTTHRWYAQRGRP